MSVKSVHSIASSSFKNFLHGNPAIFYEIKKEK